MTTNKKENAGFYSMPAIRYAHVLSELGISGAAVEETEETETETEKETEEETEPETDEDDLLSNDPVTFGLRGANGLMLTAGGAIPWLDTYITDVTISKRRGDSWVKVNEITSGHNVRIDLKYTLPEKLITSQSRKIQYQLPDVLIIRH